MAFDNLRNTQGNIAESLESALEGGFLPQSILFSGSRGTSRLTAALDLAYTLLGHEEDRELLKNANIVFLPCRNLYSEIQAAINLYGQSKNRASRLYLIETVRKALMQYPSMLASAYDKKTQGYFNQAEEVATLLYDYEAEREYSDSEINTLLKCIQKNMTQAFLNKGRRSSGVTIDEIRAIQDWFSSSSDVKIAIIENLEESTEGAKNSLLKILEEPNENGYLILLSSNPQRLLPTILSRVRKYSFPQLTEEKISRFIKDKFRLYEDYNSFEAFFFQLGADEGARKELDLNVSIYTDALLNGCNIDSDSLERILSSLDRMGAYRYFIQRVAGNVAFAMRKKEIMPIKARSIIEIINRWLLLSETYNLSSRAAIDSILREVENV